MCGDLHRRQPADRFVQHHELWPQHEAHRQLQAPLLEQREHSGDRVEPSIKLEPFDKLTHMAVLHALGIARGQRGGAQIVGDREFAEHTHRLVGAGQSGAGDRMRAPAADGRAREGDRTGVDGQMAGHHIDERGLAAAVRPDHAEGLAHSLLDVHRSERPDATELFLDLPGVEQDLIHSAGTRLIATGATAMFCFCRRTRHHLRRVP